MRRQDVAGRLAACLAVSALAVVGVASGALTSPVWARGSWNIVSSPSVNYGAELLAVSADSGGDAWAVGDSYQPSNGVNHTLAEHWNGKAWSRLATVDPGTDQQLNGVAVISPRNVWAVGFTNSSGWWANRTLVEHWNGSTWRRISSPSPTSGEDELWGVWASSATDVWAAGGASGQTLIEHWNGLSWEVIPTPNASSYDYLHRIAGSSATDVWAVGSAYQNNSSKVTPLVLHWNGSHWSRVTAPALFRSSYVTGVWSTSTGDAWIVGTWYGAPPTYTTHPLVLHWNGTTWSAVPSPASSTFVPDLWGVAARSSTDAWIVGGSTAPNSGMYRTLIEHWNGTSWTTVASPDRITTGSQPLNALDAVTILPGGLAWATGSYQSGNASGTLVLGNPSA